MDDRTTGSSSNGNMAPPTPPAPRLGPDGKPVHDQEFFIALARRGKDAWNRWRGENPDIAVTLQGVDFSGDDNNRIDFSGFRFCHHANFGECKFRDSFDVRRSDEPGLAKFAGATFGAEANFSGATLGSLANLSNVTFGLRAMFRGAIFGNSADFSRAKFGPGANFALASFGGSANFHEASFAEPFGGIASFDGATFGDHADFSEASLASGTFEAATFGRQANFRNATIVYGLFSGTTFGKGSDFSDAKFERDVSFNAMAREQWRNRMDKQLNFFDPERQQAFRALWDDGRHGPDCFQTISFRGARFAATAYFIERRFEGPCEFVGALFDRPPDFGGCEGIGNLNLLGAKFSGRSFLGGWTTDSNIPLRLRMLRKIAEDAKNHDLERDLYIEERKAERGVLFARYWHERHKPDVWTRVLAHCIWIAVMTCYWLLADYGRSFVRPLSALVLSVFAFNLAYAHVVRPPIVDNPAALGRAIKVFSIANAVPFVGALSLEKEVKQRLLCGDQPTEQDTAAKRGVLACVAIPSSKFQAVTLAQSIFSALCFFFAGLALRNYFKLR